MLESDRLTQRIENKMKEINKRYSSLKANFIQLENLAVKKMVKTDEYIQANKETTCLKIGEIMTNYYTTLEKANGLKSAIDETIAKIKIDEARANTQIEQDIIYMKNILAMTQEQFNQTHREKQEKMVEERSKIERKINNLKEEEAKEKDRLERETKSMKENKAKEKNIIDNEIQKFKDEIKRIPVKIQNMQREYEEIQRKCLQKKRI